MQEECRICFGTEEPSNKFIKPWNCKGSMQFVHEKCMNEWIRQSGLETCDLCRYKLNTKEKLLNPFSAIKRLLKYMNRDKKRYVYWLLYLFYLYLYGKRVGIVMTSFFNIFKWTKNTQLRNKLKILKMLLSLIYNVLLFVQLVYLGIIESKRIWNIFHIVSKQIKSIKILDRQEDKA